jgi:hypothetical protein
MFKWKGIQKQSFSVTLALNIFHHFIKTPEFHNKLTLLLNNLDTQVMIFESHNTQEKQMNGAYKNYSPLEFVNFIIEESSLNYYEEITTIQEDGRTIFKLYK